MKENPKWMPFELYNLRRLNQPALFLKVVTVSTCHC